MASCSCTHGSDPGNAEALKTVCAVNNANVRSTSHLSNGRLRTLAARRLRTAICVHRGVATTRPHENRKPRVSPAEPDGPDLLETFPSRVAACEARGNGTVLRR